MHDRIDTNAAVGAGAIFHNHRLTPQITRNKTSIITVEQNDAFLGLKRHLLYGTSTVVRQPVACRSTVSNVTAISAVQAGSRERISARQSAFLLKPRYSC